MRLPWKRRPKRTKDQRHELRARPRWARDLDDTEWEQRRPHLFDPNPDHPERCAACGKPARAARHQVRDPRIPSRRSLRAAGVRNAHPGPEATRRITRSPSTMRFVPVTTRHEQQARADAERAYRRAKRQEQTR